MPTIWPEVTRADSAVSIVAAPSTEVSDRRERK
jgi:hypothetical protein